MTVKPFQHHVSEVREKLGSSQIYLYNKGPSEINVRVRGSNNLYGENSVVCSGQWAGDERCYVIRQGVHYLLDNGVNTHGLYRFVQVEYFSVEDLPGSFVWAPDCVLDRYESYVELAPHQMVAIPMQSEMAITNASGISRSPVVSKNAQDLVAGEDALAAGSLAFSQSPSYVKSPTAIAMYQPRSPLVNASQSPQQQLTYSQFANHWETTSYSPKLAAQYPVTSSPRTSQLVESSARNLGYYIAQYAREQIGKLYMQGCCGPAAFDNPGLAFAAHRQTGIVIGRTAYTQSLKGKNVLYSCLEPGDLIFFCTDRCGFPCDVAVSLGGTLMVHASLPQQEIRMDRLDAYWYSMIKCARRYW